MTRQLYSVRDANDSYKGVTDGQSKGEALAATINGNGVRYSEVNREWKAWRTGPKGRQKARWFKTEARARTWLMANT